MSKLYMMIGLPGAGKSTISKELAQRYGLVRVSLDQIRREFSITDDTEGFEKAKEIAVKRIVQAFANGTDVVYDALNIFALHRVKFITAITELYSEPMEVIANVVLTRIQDCVARDIKRTGEGKQHGVGEENIYKYAGMFQPPSKAEGFEKIVFFGGSHPLVISKVFDKLPSTIMEHSLEVASHINHKTLKLAGKYHDIGKLYTNSTALHSHARMGAYMFLCSDIAKLYYTGDVSQVALDTALIIAYHMLPVEYPTYDEYARVFKKLPIPEYLCDYIYLLHSFNHPESIAP